MQQSDHGPCQHQHPAWVRKYMKPCLLIFQFDVTEMKKMNHGGIAAVASDCIDKRWPFAMDINQTS